MSSDDREVLLEAFDRLDRAAQQVLLALPSQMTNAAEGLNNERLAMRETLNKVFLRKRP